MNEAFALFGGGEAMFEDEYVDCLMDAGATGTGRGAARLVGLAKERKTALAFGLPVVDDNATCACSSLCFSSMDSFSCSDFLRFGGLGRDDSSASSCDLREAGLEPFLDAMVLALTVGGPQWAKRAALSAGARSSTLKRHCLPDARQFWQTGASGERRQRTFLARHASQALTGRVRFLGSDPGAAASDFVVEEAGLPFGAGVDGPADATDANVSAAAIMAEDVMVAGEGDESERYLAAFTESLLLRLEVPSTGQRLLGATAEDNETLHQKDCHEASVLVGCRNGVKSKRAH